METSTNLIVGEDNCKILDIVSTITKSSSSCFWLLKNWKKLARQLYLNDIDISDLEQDRRLGNLTSNDLLHSLLSAWKGSQGHCATLKILCSALESCDMLNISQALQKKFCTGTTQESQLPRNRKNIAMKTDCQLTTIINNFYTLITTINCSPELLNRFKSKRLLSPRDIKMINSFGEDSVDRAYLFFKKLLGKQLSPDIFSVLLSALKETQKHVPLKELTTSTLECRDKLFERELPVKIPTSLDVNSNPTCSKLSLSYQRKAEEMKYFNSPPPAVLEFLGSANQNILLLQSPDTKVTEYRIMDTMRNVEKISHDLIKPGKIFVTSLEGKASIPELVESLSTQKRKLIIMHSQEFVPSISPDCIGLSNCTDCIRWEDLTNSYQKSLLEKLEKICCLELDPKFIGEFIQVHNLNRLFNIDENEENNFLLGEFVENYLKDKFVILNKKFDAELMKDDLYRIAVKHFSPRCEEKLFGRSIDSQTKTNYLLPDLVSIGLLEFNSKYQFINKYVAEYYLANFVVNSGRKLEGISGQILGLQEFTTSICKKLIRSHKFENQSLLYFINFVLTKLNLKLEFLDSFDPHQIANACIRGNLRNLLGAIIPKTVVTNEMLFLAIKIGNGRTADFVLQEFVKSGKEVITDPIYEQLTFLHPAVEDGKVDITRRLLDEFGFADQLRRKPFNNLTNFCISNTTDKSEEEVEERCKIVGLLHKANPKLLNLELKGKKTLVSRWKIHQKLIQHMKSLGVNANL